MSLTADTKNGIPRYRRQPMNRIFALFTMVVLTLSMYATTSTSAHFEDSHETEALGLQFTLINNGTAYKVSRGMATASEIVIPETHNFLPVKEIAYEGFASYSDLTSVYLPSSITSIETDAFRRCFNLASITIAPDNPTYRSENNCVIARADNSLIMGCQSSVIPDGVTSIASAAFSNCRNLTNITIPSSVSSIGQYAFIECTNLTTVTIEHGVTNIGFGAFLVCASLESITLPESVTSIDNIAFSGCRSLTNLYLPNSVTNIGGPIVNECSSLTSIHLPENMTSIGYGFFLGCSSLENVDIPESVTAIGWEAFRGCSSLTSLTLSRNVANIGEEAFSGCDNLSNIVIDSNNPIYRSEGNCIIQRSNNTLLFGFGNSVIPNSVTNIGFRAFVYCSSLTNISIPSSVTNISNQAFVSCENLERVDIPSSVVTIEDAAFALCPALVIYADFESQPDGWSDAWNGNQPVVWAGVRGDISFSLINGGTAYAVSRGDCPDRDVAVPAYHNGLPVTAIADYGFYQDQILSSIDIPQGVTHIGQFAFTGCDFLSSFSLPEGLTSIGYSAFWDCPSLTSLYFPSSLTDIDITAFDTCINVSSITVHPNNPVFRSEGDCLILRNSNILTLGCKDSIIPDNVTTIWHRAFWGCENLTSIDIPNGVTRIGDEAFMFCENLVSVTLPNSLISIGDGAFWECHSLSEINIPESMVDIGFAAFFECWSLRSITIPSSMTSIGDAVFHSSGLQNVIIPDSVTSIGDDAFEFCSSLTSFTIPSSVVSIGHAAFNGCRSLTSIIIPTTVTMMGMMMFFECDNLTIYTEFESRPEGWHRYWNGDDLTPVYRPVVWGFTTEPVAPSGLVYQVNGGAVHLSWAEPTGVYVPSFVCYAVYRDGEVLVSDLTNTGYVDTSALDGVHSYYVCAVYASGVSEPSNVVTVTVDGDSDVVGVGVVTGLSVNYPNPFNPSTCIAFDMAREGQVSVVVYNSKGQRVCVLVDGVRGAGSHTVVWNGCADDGRSVGSGVYFYRMVSGGVSEVRKMVMVK